MLHIGIIVSQLRLNFNRSPRDNCVVVSKLFSVKCVVPVRNEGSRDTILTMITLQVSMQLGKDLRVDQIGSRPQASSIDLYYDS